MHPVRLDPVGLSGPTRGAARGPRWQRVAPGWYLPAAADLGVVEQRILAQSVRLPPSGAVTAWASLRWRGVAFFAGVGHAGAPVAVPLVISGSGSRAAHVSVHYSWEQLSPSEREIVDGLPCTTVERALFDEVRRRGTIRDGAVAIDMTAAANLLTVAEFAQYVDRRPAWTGVGVARGAVDLASDGSRSPQESRMRLVWVIDADLPAPLCNQPLFSLDGDLLGYPDLFDPVAGLVGEYDGADHLEEDRRRRDRMREERFRDHGLEYVAVVTGELARPASVVRRLRAAYRRAPFDPPDERRWTLDQPPWFRSRLDRQSHA